MFYLSYMLAELRRRRGRTILTALGLAVGVGLVVTMSALSSGLDTAQRSVLQPLTGVGTDITVTRPIKLSANGGAVFNSLSPQQQSKLRNQTRGGAGFGFGGAKPGSTINQDVANSPQVSFSDSRAGSLASLANVTGAAGYLTLNVNHISGKVPKVRIGSLGRSQHDRRTTAAGLPGVRQIEHQLQLAQRHRRRSDQAQPGAGHSQPGRQGPLLRPERRQLRGDRLAELRQLKEHRRR